MINSPDQYKQPVDWAKVDGAIFCWVRDRLGVETIWERQDIPQPCYPYVSIFRGSERDEGGVDETRSQTVAADGTPVNDGSAKEPYENEELLYQPIDFTVTFQCHVDFDSGATDPAGEAKRLLGLLKRTVYQTSTQSAFDAAGLSVVSTEQIQDISLVINGSWISRAALDIIFRTAAVITERVPFFEHVRIQSDTLDVDTIIDAS